MCTALSAPDSRFAVEAFTMRIDGNRQRWTRMRDRLGLDVNVEALTYHEPGRSDPAQWLVDHGWRVHSVDNHQEMARLGRPVPEDMVNEAVTTRLIWAHRPSQ
jgi:O-methyltransferase involved in polyketide biosynthesis